MRFAGGLDLLALAGHSHGRAEVSQASSHPRPVAASVPLLPLTCCLCRMQQDPELSHRVGYRFGLRTTSVSRSVVPQTLVRVKQGLPRSCNSRTSRVCPCIARVCVPLPAGTPIVVPDCQTFGALPNTCHGRLSLSLLLALKAETSLYRPLSDAVVWRLSLPVAVRPQREAPRHCGGPKTGVTSKITMRLTHCSRMGDGCAEVSTQAPDCAYLTS